MKKSMFTRLRDPCPNCLVVCACTISCEDKHWYERQLERRGALKDPYNLLLYGLTFIFFIFLIVFIPGIWIILLYDSKN